MRFRAKVFLSVLIPAALLVGLAVAAAVIGLSREAEAAAKENLARTRTSLTGVLRDQFDELRRLSHPFDNARINVAISDAVQTGSLKNLRQEVASHFGYIGYEPAYYEVWDLDGKSLLRKSAHHACTPACAHEMPAWIDEREGVFTVLDGEPYFAYRLEHEDGTFVFGTPFRKFLEQLCKDFAIEVVLIHDGAAVFQSEFPWALGSHEKQGGMENVRAGGVRYLWEDVRPEHMILDRLLLFRSMEAVDRQVNRSMIVGLAGLGLSVLAAGVVSARVSRGISAPVERLVEATHKVGEGDYTAKVDIPGRDEMARLGGAFNDMTEGLRKRREIMEKTLSRDVAEAAMKGMALGGVRRQVTILFMDVRGFTSATEGVDPADVVATLNDMLRGQAAAIDRYGGNVNKYLGDGLMAMFGAPEPLENHARASVDAAREMCRAMVEWNGSRTGEGRAPLQIGIGINTGTVLGGWVGHESRLEYTLIGEEVNLSARVCGKAAPGQILMTKQTYDQIGDGLRVRELEPVQVKGLSYPVQIYEVLG